MGKAYFGFGFLFCIKKIFITPFIKGLKCECEWINVNEAAFCYHVFLHRESS